ncbi:MAG: phage scaffolding protein [Zhenhengia sp.]|uniref:phage scaffolding protein n=1 Tax=Zhenhengia sp. TaxID=2944208 RepID=UPI0039956B9D
MKRKFLEDLGLEKEDIDSIMAENGKDVEKAKADYEDVKAQLETAHATITDLKKNNVDNEKLQNKVTEYETEITKLKDEAAKKDFNYRLEDALKGSKAKNLKALKALLDMDKVKLEGDKFTGLEEQLTALKESDAYLFDAEEQQPPQLGGFKPTNTGGASKGITKEQFHKMSYSERAELYNAQPEVYKQLTQ